MRWQWRLSSGRTMDSQGRKVVVCDNGTGVSAWQGGRGGHRPGWGRAEDARALGAGGCTPGPSGHRGQGARGSPLPPPQVWGTSGQSPGWSPRACHPHQPSGLGRRSRPALDGDLACCSAEPGSACLLWAIWLKGRRGKRLGLCVREGLHSPGSPVCKKGKEPEAFLFLYRYRTGGRKRV